MNNDKDYEVFSDVPNDNYGLIPHKSPTANKLIKYKYEQKDKK